MVECGQFLDGVTWGPVVTADLKLGGEQASSVPIQVIGGPNAPAVPSDCSSVGPPENTLADLGANGILGVGLFRQDCGGACVTTGAGNPGLYYACPSSGCVITAQSLTRQLQNPVWMFPTDNNGVLIQLPALPAGGALTSTGMMIFGIGTQSDNALGSAKVLTVDGAGTLPTIYGSQTYSSTFIDSGSNGIFFLDSFTTGLPVCTDYRRFLLSGDAADAVGDDPRHQRHDRRGHVQRRQRGHSQQAISAPSTRSPDRTQEPSTGGCRSSLAEPSSRQSKGRARPAGPDRTSRSRRGPSKRSPADYLGFTER